MSREQYIQKRLVQVCDSEEKWENSDVILHEGELLLIKNSDNEIKFKIGNGVSKFKDLDYFEINPFKKEDYALSTNTVSYTGSGIGVGSSVQGVYVNKYGVATPLTYRLNKTVPTDAEFTDTHVTDVSYHYTPSENTSANISASEGTLTDITNSTNGVQVVTGLKRDAAGHVVGVTSVALKSTNTDTGDTKVTQTLDTVSDSEIPVLLSYQSNPDSGLANIAKYSNVTVNPSSNEITATKFNGDLNGTADKAINDSAGKNIASTYAPKNSPKFTGTPTRDKSPDISANGTDLATTAFVQSIVDSKISASDAMIYKGTLGTNGTITSLPSSTAKKGWTYKVITSGTYDSYECNSGDMIICLTDGSSYTDATWTIIQNNTDIMTGATETSSGSSGFVPMPKSGDENKFLKGDATWDIPSDVHVTESQYHYTPIENSNSNITASNGDVTELGDSETGVQVINGLKMDDRGHVVGVTSVGLKANDVKITQAATNDGNNYPILFTNTPSATVTEKNTSKFNKNITITPNTGTITATNFKGLASNALQDDNGDVISSTYVKQTIIPNDITVVNLQNKEIQNIPESLSGYSGYVSSDKTSYTMRDDGISAINSYLINNPTTEKFFVDMETNTVSEENNGIVNGCSIEGMDLNSTQWKCEPIIDGAIQESSFIEYNSRGHNILYQPTDNELWTVRFVFDSTKTSRTFSSIIWYKSNRVYITPDDLIHYIQDGKIYKDIYVTSTDTSTGVENTNDLKICDYFLSIDGTALDSISSHYAEKLKNTVNFEIDDKTEENKGDITQFKGNEDNIILHLPEKINATLKGNADTASKIKSVLNGTTKAYLLGSTIIPTEEEQNVSTIVDGNVYIDEVDGKLVAINFSGDLTGNVTGNVIGNVTGNSDTASKIKSNVSTTTKAYLLGSISVPTEEEQNVSTIIDTNVYLDNTSGKLTASTFSGKKIKINNNNNNSCSLTYDDETESLDLIFS